MARFTQVLLVLAAVSCLLRITNATVAKCTLKGKYGVPPISTTAKAEVELVANADEGRVHLSISKIVDMTMAHLHAGNSTTNGPPLVWLMPAFPVAAPYRPPLTASSLKATTTFNATNVLGTLAGSDLTNLLKAVAAGGVYVNIHTGNFPAGEIRCNLVCTSKTCPIDYVK